MWGMKDMVEGCVVTIVIITASLSFLRVIIPGQRSMKCIVIKQNAFDSPVQSSSNSILQSDNQMFIDQQKSSYTSSARMSIRISLFLICRCPPS